MENVLRIWYTCVLPKYQEVACSLFTSFKLTPFPINRVVASRRRGQTSELAMIFDFLKQRAEEGISQVQNIATKTLEGKLGEALQESASYIRTRQKADIENLRYIMDGLSQTREQILAGIQSSFKDDESKSIEDILSGLEETLLQVDIGSTTTNQILDDLRIYSRKERIKAEDIPPVMRTRLIEALSNAQCTTEPSTLKNPPYVYFIIGANGMGKTTTIGKLSARLVKEMNATVLVSASDTFRAAAVEQLQEWTDRAGVQIELPKDEEKGGSPLPVLERSLRRAVAENFDVVIVDTCGRLSNNFDLIQQLQDMKAVIIKEIGRDPDDTLLVVDASIGRNAVDQAKAWQKYVGLSGLIITKLDGTARAGFVVPVVKELGIPVKFIGVGEKIDDLREFQAENFVDALLGSKPEDKAMLLARAQQILGSK